MTSSVTLKNQSSRSMRAMQHATSQMQQYPRLPAMCRYLVNTTLRCLQSYPTSSD